MSIPPLVCSTPPPLDQCEDDRNTEDFDIQYNLSQEDDYDGNNYNYGTYTDYIYPTSTSTNIQQGSWSPDISKDAENKLDNNLLKEKTDSINILPESDSSSVNKLGFEDVEEDLNLKIEDENDVVTVEQSINKCDPEPLDIDSSSKELDTSMHVTAVIDKNKDVEISAESQVFPSASLVKDDDYPFEENAQPVYVEENAAKEDTQSTFDLDVEENNVKVTEIEKGPMSTDITDIPVSVTTVIDQIDSNISENKIDDLVDDDFGDFDDFQFIPSENNAAPTIQFCDNPWDSEETKDCEFGDFSAHFDDTDANKQTNTDDLHEDETNIVEQSTHDDDNDDFGDFDDFKSSYNDNTDITVLKNEPSQNVPVLNFHSPDSEGQIIESINGVLSSIFASEISEHDSDFESKLDSMLNETWGHLVDMDVRQPYIVNWNNSLGQKTLLKALCIDSRNILFGPKWNNGMPKYAANLTVAPLQPQKPFTTTNTVNSEDQNPDKNTNKETSTWTDPFTSDGKESCNTENGTSATVARPTNLDVFTNVIPPEMNKIYSSTLSVQPIRQINLPDTHIFTPTDSETPRSKTIHYDRGPPVLVPSEDNHQRTETQSQTKSEMTVNNSANDEDYWEFQDFKGSVGSKNASNPEEKVVDKSDINATSKNTLPTITGNFQTDILQPIKVEPITPALNWPAPGEVKETFDDFSDFISNTSWNNDNVNTVNQTDNQLTSKQEAEPVSKTVALDDDFETFQSAPTIKSSTLAENNLHNINQSTAHIDHHNLSEVTQNITETNDISHITHSKTDNIDTIKTKESFVQNPAPLTVTNNVSTVKETSIKSSPVFSSVNQNINATLLQPSIASTSGSQRNQQKTGQILQPLSLESYSQINWPNPGIDLQDLSRFNPVESLQSLKTEGSTGGSSKMNSPAHKDTNTTRNEITDDDIWGDFVSSKPKQLQTKKLPVFADDDEWTEFVSSPSVKPQNGLNTISYNVHTNLNMQKTSGQNKYPTKNNQIPLDIPTLNYVTKSSNRGLYNDKHFQNL
ncbi:uncharacterized protein Afti [Epargyreus clarus]|uniref:uncharacterized protein Afti n=1 Tax=Epargyreus clarus TaxID=520877 RepID=UPI003C2F085D